MTSPKTISFAVGSRFGPRSWKWILTIDGQDLYIAPSVMRKKWKVTLHASGRWHVKEVGRRQVAPIIRAHARDMAPNLHLCGLVIVIPDSCLRPASDVDKASPVDQWLPRPPHDGFVEVVIGDWKLERDGDSQPMEDEGFELLFCLTSETTGVFIAHRALPIESPGARHHEQCLQSIRAELPRPIVLDSPERRTAAFFNTAGGAIRILEVAVD